MHLFCIQHHGYKLAAIYVEDSCCFRLSETWATTPAPALWSHSFFTWIQTAEWIELKRNRGENTYKRKSQKECTWMLLWAEKGQNVEWKLTSTFFHPNCCKPRIISSVDQPNTSLLCHVMIMRFSSNKSFTSSFLVDWYVPSIISWYSIVFCVLGAFCAASFALAASGGKCGPSEEIGGQYPTSTTCL